MLLCEKASPGIRNLKHPVKKEIAMELEGNTADPMGVATKAGEVIINVKQDNYGSETQRH